jgi:YbbR domain-containing protein
MNMLRQFPRNYIPQLSNFLRANYEWVLISLGLGFLIWMVASLDQNPVQQREFSEALRIEFIEDASGEVTRAPNNTLANRRVTVTLRAPRSTWDTINSDDIRVVADLRGLEPGTHTIELEGEIVNDDLPGRVISLSPPELSVELVAVSERLIQLNADIASQPSPEFLAEITACEPQQITVRGPAPEVDRVASAITRLDVADLSTSATVNGAIVLFNASGRPITTLTTEPETVICQVEISQRPDVVAVHVEANIIGDVPDGFQLVEDYRIVPEEVLVTGDMTAIEAMQGVALTEPIDVTDQRENFSRNVSVQLPDGVTLVQPTQLVTVNININEQNATRTFDDIPVRVLNLDLGLIVELSPPTVSVDVTGPQSIISGLTAEDISATVDLEGRGEGRFEDIPVEVSFLRESLQGDLNIAAIVQPPTISATISIEVLETVTPDAQPLIGQAN